MRHTLALLTGLGLCLQAGIQPVHAEDGVPVQPGRTVLPAPRSEDPVAPFDADALPALLDRAARLLRRGADADALRALEHAYGRAQDTPCRLRQMLALARLRVGSGAATGDLLEGCGRPGSIAALIGLREAEEACRHGDLRYALRRLRKLRRQLLDDDVLARAEADAIEVGCVVAHGAAARALPRINAFLRTYPEAPMRPKLEVARLKLLEKLGRRRAACRLGQELILHHASRPETAEAVELVGRLRAARRCGKRSWATRIGTGWHLVVNKKWETAKGEMEAFEADLYRGAVPEDHQVEVEAILLRYFDQNALLDRAQRLLLRRGRVRDAETWRWLFRLRKARGDYKGALRALRRIPMHATTKRLKRFELAVDFARWDKAVPLGRRILDSRRRPARGILFRAAIAEWLGGEMELALRHFDSLMKRGKRRRHGYFRGLVLRDMGRIDEAGQAWAEIVAESRHDYYGTLAGSRLAELGLLSEGEALRTMVPLEPSHLAAALPTPARPRLGGDGATAAASPERLPLPGDEVEVLLDGAIAEVGDLLPRLERARQAWRLGMIGTFRHDLRTAEMEVWRAYKARGKMRRFLERAPGSVLDNRAPARSVWGRRMSPHARVPRTREARRAFARRIRRLRELWDEPGMHRLAELLHAAGEPMLPMRYALQRGGWREDAPGELRSWARPLPWRAQVDGIAARTGVPPVLLYGIMSIESAFQPEAISRANARGLFQVMPQTAVRMALGIGEPAPTPTELLDQERSLYLGSRYLGMLLEEFRDQIPLVLAGYNGGPHRVKEWLRQRGRLPLDVFVELIPFGQARLYVQKGIVRIAATLRAHTEVDGLYVSRLLDPVTAGRLDY